MPRLQNFTNFFQGTIPYVIGAFMGIITTIICFIAYAVILINLPRDLQIKYGILTTMENQGMNIPKGNYTY